VHLLRANLLNLVVLVFPKVAHRSSQCVGKSHPQRVRALEGSVQKTGLSLILFPQARQRILRLLLHIGRSILAETSCSYCLCRARSLEARCSRVGAARARLQVWGLGMVHAPAPRRTLSTRFSVVTVALLPCPLVVAVKS
jgi:hypothetical protein